MKGSASDSSIVDMVERSGDQDCVDGVHRQQQQQQQYFQQKEQRKRSGSVKKRVGNVFKSMKKPKSGTKTHTNNHSSSDADTPSPLSPDGIETSAVVADVGFTSPYNKKKINNKEETLPPPERDSQQQHFQEKEAETNSENSTAGVIQLKNLEAHRELLLLSKSNQGQDMHFDNKHYRHDNGHTSSSSLASSSRNNSPTVERRETGSQTQTSSSPHKHHSIQQSRHPQQQYSQQHHSQQHHSQQSHHITKRTMDDDMIPYNSRLAVVVVDNEQSRPGADQGKDQICFFHEKT